MSSSMNNTRVEGKRIEVIYSDFRSGKLKVNRRYQRKLVWSLEQKQSLIDSAIKNLRIPLILLAKSKKLDGTMEVVDGLQRLDAIIAFIENRFPYSMEGENGEREEKYFNLETLGETKLLSDNGTLKQRTPKMTREESLKITGYTIPISIYEVSESSDIDETFRRINSSGRKLGMQEVRQAGSISKIATLVRKISAEIRGDNTSKEILPLESMRKHSLRWKDGDNNEGISVEESFWLRHKILSEEDLRVSADEQLVCDLLMDILSPRPYEISSKTRDDSYDDNSEISRQLNSAIGNVEDQATIIKNFLAINDCIETIIQKYSERKSWAEHVGRNAVLTSRRYFHVTFMAFYSLRFKKNMVVSDWAHIAKQLEGYWKRSGELPRGGTWSPGPRTTEINKLIGAIQDGFIEDSDPMFAVPMQQSQRFKREFSKYHEVENNFYELKMGLSDLSCDKEKGDIKSRRAFFEKIIKTATAMANTTPKAEGAIYIGIADKKDTANKIQDKFGISPLDFSKVNKGLPSFVFGIDHELEYFSLDLDELKTTLISWISHCNNVTNEDFLRNLANSIDYIWLSDSENNARAVLALYPRSVDKLVWYGDACYERVGSSNKKLTGESFENRLKYFEFQSSKID